MRYSLIAPAAHVVEVPGDETARARAAGGVGGVEIRSEPRIIRMTAPGE